MPENTAHDTATPDAAAQPHAAIVLAGGRASRLDGADKASIQIDGRMLLDHALAAVVGCAPVIVVGPPHLATAPGRTAMTLVREDPPFTGPVAAIDAALKALEVDTVLARGNCAGTRAKFENRPRASTFPSSRHPRRAPNQPDETWLLACDLPRAAEVVATLSAAIPPDFDAAVLVDAAGRRQWLAGRYRTASLRSAVGALPDTAGASMRQLLANIRVHDVPDESGASTDLDTWTAIDDYRSKREDTHG
ncbi:molybdenum cofactor guanylyltransferase [Paramicrobacterium chengjingii]|uniref:molybdenum cofactor guanylyltransferase n=1 Tax=Paramicrobacterium chengjingii TaxID=2769067 RepID=UPI0014208685|nr:NTP transferase domain-containing protein [Microbacterium chengjingii]